MKQHIQIIGAGQMGQGIAQVCLHYGYHVTLVDQNDEQLKKAKHQLAQKIIPETLDHLDLSSVVSQEKTFLLIEAIVENISIKKDFWSNLNHDTIDILSSNTSSYSITDLAFLTGAPEKFIGLHFMNPVPKMPLVEVICGDKTAQDIHEKALHFIKSIEKTPVQSKDSPGFIVNRILIPMINEAALVFESGVGSAKDVDAAMTLGCHHPLGPLALADLIGLDTCFAILDDLYHRLKNDKYRPCSVFSDYIKAGRLGRKSGEGFYVYATSASK